MQRRRFTSALVTAGLAGSGLVAPFLSPRRAAAQQDDVGDDQSNDRPAFGHIELRTPTQIFVPVRMFIVSTDDTRPLGIDLTRTFPIQNENRIGLLTPTLRRKFRGADQIGELRQDGTTLVAVTNVPVSPGNIFLLNGATAYRIDGEKLSHELEGRVPILGDLPVLGRIFRQSVESPDKDDLLIFVTPTIHDDAM